MGPLWIGWSGQASPREGLLGKDPKEGAGKPGGQLDERTLHRQQQVQRPWECSRDGMSQRKREEAGDGIIGASWATVKTLGFYSKR